MTTYKLDETPDTYISAVFDQGSYVYKMFSIKGESSHSFIRIIDLRNDKLIVYGTEIKESMWDKLHNSLLLKAKAGNVFVDCNGACYIAVYQTDSSNNTIVGVKFYRPIDNVIFDWSQFGVTVPNSVNDSLVKQLQQKDKEVWMMDTLLSTMNTLVSSANDNRMQQQDAKMELQKVRKQLELSQEEVKELQEQVTSSNKKDYDKYFDMELQKVQHELSCVKSELETIKFVCELSKKLRNN